MHRHTLTIPGLLLAASLLVSVGCEPKGRPVLPTDGPGAEDPVHPDDAWVPEPSAVSVFPSSRFIIENDQPLLETRLEIRDQMGHPLKASGGFRFELFAVPDNPDAARRLYNWTVPLYTAAQHREHYDPIVDGYRFQLRIGDLEVAERKTLLRVTFTPAQDGLERLTGQRVIKIDW